MAQLAVRALVLISLVTTFVPAAFAQDDPKFALLASFPSPTVSFQWELTERWALRLDGSYTFRDDTITESTPGESMRGLGGTVVFRTPDIETRQQTTAHTGTVGVSGIYSFHRSEQLRLYLAPRLFLGYTTQRISVSVTTSSLPPGFPPGLLDDLLRPQSFEASSKSPGAGLSFGAATNVHSRLALYGEAGVVYQRTSAPQPLLTGITGIRESIETKRTTVNTRALGGVMFRF